MINEPIAQFFRYAHLPPDLQRVSRPFHELAGQILTELPRNAERTVALRKLLEAKDAAVRAAIYKEPAPLGECSICGEPIPPEGMDGCVHWTRIKR